MGVSQMNTKCKFILEVAACLVMIPALVTGQQQVVPPPPIIVSKPVVTINDGPGDQTQPHVSKDRAPYTDVADGSIHYYKFSTGIDTAIPFRQSQSDTLSDINGNRVSFTRQTISGDFQIAVFDVQSSSLTEI